LKKRVLTIDVNEVPDCYQMAGEGFRVNPLVQEGTRPKMTPAVLKISFPTGHPTNVLRILRKLRTCLIVLQRRQSGRVELRASLAAGLDKDSWVFVALEVEVRNPRCLLPFGFSGLR